LKEGLTWNQADEACRMSGGRLPEITSIKENIDILKLRVNLT
jgi:hypothetical protein